MLSLDKYTIIGIIDDFNDYHTAQKRKRVVVVRPHYTVGREYDINPNIPNKKGPIKAHTKNVLGVPASMVVFSVMLERVLPG